GVSRPVVREAFRSLSALKLIDIGDGRRARVSDIDASVLGLVLDHAVRTDQINILQIYDVRRLPEAIALASRNRLFALIVASFSVVTRQTWPISWVARPTDSVRMESVEFH